MFLCGALLILDDVYILFPISRQERGGEEGGWYEGGTDEDT